MVNHEVKRVYVGNKIATNVLFLDWLHELGLKKDDMKPCSVFPLFNHIEAMSEGVIHLSMTIESKSMNTSSPVDFYTIKLQPSYNIILRKNWVTPNMAICFTYHFVIKFSIELRIAKVLGVGKKQNRNNLRIAYAWEERRLTDLDNTGGENDVVNPVIQILSDNPLEGRVVGTQVPTNIINILRQYMDVSIWSLLDMTYDLLRLILGISATKEVEVSPLYELKLLGTK